MTTRKDTPMRKLFYEDIDKTDFTACVISCEPTEVPGCFRVLLDATAFFPNAGGQSADAGTLSGMPVLDVKEEKDMIYHYVKKSFTPGDVVNGHVDRIQRFDFMQQHSGEHIISGLVHKHFGYHNVGFHLSCKEVTLDFDGVLNSEALSLIEKEANEAVFQNLPVIISYPSAEELAALSYRSKIEIEGQVRIVTIPGIDVCACCAPHVSHTGCIGMIKIISCQSHRGGVRLHIACGGRALADYTQKQNSVSAVSVALSAKPELVADAVLKLKEESIRQKDAFNALQAEYLHKSILSLPSPKEAVDAILFVNTMDTIAIRNTVNALMETYTGYCGVFSGNETEGYRFIAGSKHADITRLAVTLRKHLGAKCGGNAPMIQGSITAAPAVIQQYFHSAED